MKSDDKLDISHNGEMELTFDLIEDADRFFNVLNEVQAELESSWTLHARAFGNIDAAFASPPSDTDLRATAAKDYAREVG